MRKRGGVVANPDCPQGSYINIRKRYSEFDDFRKRLVQTFPNFEAAVPALPPKSLLSKFQPRFLEKRRVGLEYFLKYVIHPAPPTTLIRRAPAL